MTASTIDVRVVVPFARGSEEQLARQLHAAVTRVAAGLGLSVAASIALDTVATVPGPRIWVGDQRVRYSREAILRARMSVVGRLLSIDEAASGPDAIADDSVEPAVRTSWIARIVEHALVSRPEVLATSAVVAELAATLDIPEGELGPLLRGVLACGVSIRSPDHLGATIGALAAGRAVQRLEDLLDCLHPRQVVLELAPGDVKLLLTTDPHRDQAPFKGVHERAYAELGVELPRIHLAPCADVPGGFYRVRVNHLAELEQPLLPVGHVLAANTEQGNGRYILAWNREAAVMQAGRDDAAFTALDYLAFELYDALARRMSRLVNCAEVTHRCAALRKPALVGLAMASPHYQDLPRVLRALLAENVSIADLERILERLIDHHEVRTPPPRSHLVLTRGCPVSEGLPASPDRLVDSVRLALGGAIRARVAPDNQISVLVLSPTIERTLIDGPTAAWCDALVDTMVACAESSAAEALLTTHEIRARLRALCGDALPDFPILSFQELPSTTEVSAVGTVDLPATPLPAEVRRPPIAADRSEVGFAVWLADAATRMPALEGLVDDAVAPPEPDERVRRARAFAHDAGRSPDSLADQGWGILVPRGPRGEQLEAAIAPLIDYRVNEQRAMYRLFRVAPGLDAAASSEWVRSELEAVPVHRRPRYLLILGDLSEVSLDLQLRISPLAGVGRLAFDDIMDYRRYAEKAAAADRRRRERIRPVIFLGDDGSQANAIARAQLVEPCAVRLDELGRDSRYRLASPHVTSDGKAGLIARARDVDVLLTVCHGAGSQMPYGERRRLQGALLTAPGELMTGDDIAGQPFVKDGVWFMFACYGLGTPARSSYSAWIDDLHRLGRLRDRDRAIIQAGELLSGEAPFIADLPRRALANPEGPLAIIGHIDLAWSYGFTHDGQSRFDRLFSTLDMLLQEHVAGLAIEQLVRNCVIASDQLTELYLQRAEHQRGRAPPVAPRLLASTWMLRQDLRGFVMLGDPAARIRLSGTGGDT